jgi:hypothetical protein
MRIVFLLGLSMLSLGCGNPAANMPSPETVAVTGKAVKADGSPITSGSIRFAIPDGPGAHSELKADGTFALKSFGGKEGAMPGKYKVYLDSKALGNMDKKFLDEKTTTVNVEITKDTKDVGTITFK